MDPYIGEIRIFAGTYAPLNWQLCDGTLLPIRNNEVLFSLIGTTYGGDGVNTFAIPDLRGRLAISLGQGPGLTTRVAGQSGGTEQATLDGSSMTAHTHTLNTAGVAATTPTTGQGVTFANTTGQITMYMNAGATPAPTKVNPFAGTVVNTGSGTPHENVMPCVALNYIISLVGIYPQAQ